MKKFFLILTLITAVYTIKAQNLISVQHGSDVTIYTNLDTAIINAPSGSTVYIPSGSFALNTPINKLLYIVGVGHNPDSSSATNITFITGNVNLVTGASSGSMSGLYLNNGMSISTIINDSIYNYTVSRCYLGSLYIGGNLASNIIFSENIIDETVTVYNSTNFAFLNNIIHSHFNRDYSSMFINSIFKNNIFLYNLNYTYNGYWLLPLMSRYSLIENNIFVGSTNNLASVSNSVAKNNLFVENITFPNGTNIGYNNIVNQAQNSIFINYTGNYYTDNYHLQPSCLGKNAGTDGTDVGIYGGQFPWKDGSVPNAPHIIKSNIGDATNSDGTLPVNIKVEAQSH